MSDNTLKNALILLAILLAVIFVWQPLSRLLFGTATTNDFVLETNDGTLDSRQLRGKVLAVSLGYAHCADECAHRLAGLVKGYEMLDSGARGQVRMILVSADPDRDTPESIGAYARSLHPDMIGATGTPENLATLASGFGATYNKLPAAADGSYRIDHSHPIYLVDTEGRFVSALNENAVPEQVAQSLRSKLSAQQPLR
ncbi:MAG: SCO family protein [Betaproteobacteria bacterium]|nr:SCO family protein [Betaproteobacteria bacterium]